MIKIGDLNKCAKTPESIITIGKFGVLHKGHEELLKILKSQKLYPIVFSFTPSPKLFFSKNPLSDGRIFDIRHINSILNRYFNGDYLYFLQKFNHNFASITPEVFVELLIERFNMKHLIAGSDFTFGAGKMGNARTLESLALRYNFNISIIENNNSISTTFLRELLQQGRLEEFNNLTSFEERFKIAGTVVRGMQLAGKALGFKTANILPSMNRTLPLFGVYFVKIKIDDKIYNGIANIGIKPTINNTSRPILEVHIINFNRDIYGKKIEIEFLQFIREERKFESLEMLKKQIASDIQKAKNFAY